MLRALRLLATAVLGLAGSLACSGSDVFMCNTDQQCSTSAILGTCEPEGVCSFPDLGCPSRRRYGELSGPQSGECVPQGGSETGVDPSSGSGSGPPPTSGASGVLDGGSSSGTDGPPSTSGDGESTGGGGTPYAACVGPEDCTPPDECVAPDLVGQCLRPCVARTECPAFGEDETWSVLCVELPRLSMEPRCVVRCNSLDLCPPGMQCATMTQGIPACLRSTM